MNIGKLLKTNISLVLVFLLVFTSIDSMAFAASDIDTVETEKTTEILEVPVDITKAETEETEIESLKEPEIESLEVPTNISIVPTEDTITIAWSEVDEATSYEIEVDGVATDNGDTSYVHKELEAGTEHSYRIKAKNESSESEWSDVVTQTTLETQVIELLEVPTNISIVATEDTITITWSEVDEATSYEIEVDGEVKDNGASTSYVHKELEAGIEHSYRIRAKNESSESEWSDVVTETTLEIQVIDLLEVPTNISIVATEDTITITWCEVDVATSYEIEVDGVATDNGADTRYIHKELEAGTEHSYRVRAKDESRVSEWSELVTEMTLSTPVLEEPVQNTEMEGLGTAEEPYIILTKDHFLEINNNIIAYYELGNDIDFLGEELTPINEFTGTLDGNGHYIKNYVIKGEGKDNQGLFKKATDATFKNLKLDQVTVTGKDNVGALLGSGKEVVIENVNVEETGKITGNDYVGGLVGSLEGSINQSSSKVEASGNNYVGGLTGYLSGTARECYAEGKVAGTNEIGGLIGRIYNTYTIVKNSYALGEVEGSEFTGGLAGYVQGNDQKAYVTNCYSASKSKVPLIGYTAAIKVTESYYDGIASRYEPQKSTDVALLTSDMTQQAKFDSWDFDTIWNIEEGTSYPYLRNVEESNKVRDGLPTGEVAGGKGTLANPYLIRTQEQLDNIRYSLGSSYKLENDIDMQRKQWIPIGMKVPFTGTLDGNGYYIKNYVIKGEGIDNQGLFGMANKATFKNINLELVTVTGKDYVGALLGLGKEVIIENVDVKEIGKITGNDYVGGLVGSLEGSINQSSSKVDVSGNNYVGGLTGYLSGTARECYAEGKIAGTKEVGGLIGRIYNTHTIVENCYALGEVEGSEFTGGLAGYVQGNDQKAYITNCYSGSKSKVPLIGYTAAIKVTNSYYDGIASRYEPQKSTDIALLTSDMTQQAKFDSWDFDTIWNIEEGGSYPYLRNVKESSKVRDGLPTGEVAGGKGTLANPYLIRTQEQLDNIRYSLGSSYKLENDIDMQRNQWIPIGMKVPFTGTIDGNGYYIKNYVIQGEGIDNQGLFSQATNAVFKDLKLDQVTVTGNDNVGALLGSGKDVIIKYVNIDEMGKITGNDSVGGLVGSLEGSISQSSSKVEVAGYNYIGGLLGYLSGTVRECYAEGKVVGNKQLGGLIGRIYKTQTLVENSYALGEVEGKNFAGGLVGYVHGYMNDDQNKDKEQEADIKKVKENHNDKNSKVKEYRVNIINCYSGSKSNVPLIGHIVTSKVTNSYFDFTLSGIKKPEEQAKTTQEMMQKLTFIDWDFVDTWKIKEGESYPTLKLIPIPRNIRAEDRTTNSIKMKWDAVEAVVGYEIEVDSVVIDNGTSTTYNHTGLNPSEEHIYKVRAKEGSWSEEVHEWTLPVAPQNINMEVTPTKITINWDPVKGATGYDVEVQGKAVDNGKRTTYINTEIIPNMQYVFRVRAKNEGGFSKWSEFLSLVTITDIPNNLSSENEDTIIKLNWNAVAGADSYEIEIDSNEIKESATNSYTHENLTPSTEHSYRVRSISSVGASEWSQLYKAKTRPLIPQNLQAVASNKSIQLSWDESVGSTAYEIEVDGEIINTGSSAEYCHNDLQPNSEHTYRVRGKNGDSISRWSELIIEKTLLDDNISLTYTSTSTEIVVKWNSIIGAKSYDIEVDGVVIPNALNTQYTHNSLEPNTEHSYRVRAWNDVVPGEWSELITVSTKLGIPQNIKIYLENSAIKLTWDIVEGSSGYDVMVDGNILDIGNKTEYIHENLEPNSYHVYRIRAKSGSFLGEWSEGVTASTSLGIPYGLRYKATSDKIIINWENVRGADGYDIKVDGDVINVGDHLRYVHDNLKPSTTHKYRVRAKNGSSVGDWSKLITCTTAPPVPTNLQATATINEITLTWDGCEGDEYYEVIADGVVISDIEDGIFIHKGLKANTWHSYKVRAVNDGGVSEWSEELSKNTNPEIQVNPGKDNLFNFVVVAPAKKNVEFRRIVVTYNPDELEVVDLCAITPELNKEAGVIEGTNIKVASCENGVIEYIVKNNNKTIVNSLKFISKVNKLSRIVYSVD
ncbi:fibronectin type III domain-containing protein [Abyssisolibacter fermentans]|uniref:fibronectin type III domain-containing protein n=1 Tax=Abyssisolibacter fermentans TaxID=1766203 RepID=UPI000835917C|nr:fibronectin type III domain-containing protein [Abyssisolibacter fermentans]